MNPHSCPSISTHVLMLMKYGIKTSWSNYVHITNRDSGRDSDNDCDRDQCCQPKWKNIVDFGNSKIETPHTALKSTLGPLF